MIITLIWRVFEFSKHDAFVALYLIHEFVEVAVVVVVAEGVAVGAAVVAATVVVVVAEPVVVELAVVPAEVF